MTGKLRATSPVKNINELDAGDREDLINRIEDLLPVHAFRTTGLSWTWTTPKSLWNLQVDWGQTRYTVTNGEQKFVRFDNDTAWLEQVLRHFGAIE